jgi:hypothetical protein
MAMKDMSPIRTLLAISVTTVAPTVCAFELPTHAAMTSEAIAPVPESSFSRDDFPGNNERGQLKASSVLFLIERIEVGADEALRRLGPREGEIKRGSE